ncbi:MAG: hypothetical protein M3228_14090 [Actinomycetota bacterium]|nr:hypothetical protein [Actinomycetota bacterium]
MSSVLRAITAAGREAFGLLVDDGAVAVGILVAVGVAALLSISGLLGSDEVIGWALFMLVWLALAVSLRRARSRLSQADGEPGDKPAA